MDINQILELLSTIPTWLWVFGGFIVFMLLFGDRKLWELEVKFPMKHGVGRGEVELKCLKKKGSSIEVEFELEELFHNKKIEIFINNRLIYTVPESKTTSSRIYVNEKFTLQTPNEGDKVNVSIGGQQQFEGVLVKD